MEQENKFLGTEKIPKLLRKFAIPCVISILISALYNIVDQIFIGNHPDLGYLGNAATSVVFPITVITMAFSWAIGDGAAAFMSICQGRKDTKTSPTSVGNSLLVNLIISILFVIAGFAFIDQILYLFGATEATLQFCRDYFSIVLAFVPAFMTGNVLGSIVRADGSPAYSMAMTLSGAITNIILDPLFIFGFGWGIKGAAWATILGQVLTFVLGLIYLFRTKTFKLKLQSFRPQFSVFQNVVKLGVSTFITQMAIVVISMVANLSLAKWGAVSEYGADIPIASIGICIKVFTIIINIAVGIIVGAQPILGYNMGAGKNDRVRELFKLVIKIVIPITLVATLITEIYPDFIIKLFGTNSDLYMEFARFTFRTFLLGITLTCLIKVISIFFQAVGEPLKAAIVSLSRDIVFFVPLMIILPNFMGVQGVLWAAPIADVLGIIVAITFAVRFFHKLDKGKIVTLGRDLA